MDQNVDILPRVTDGSQGEGKSYVRNAAITESSQELPP